MKVTVLAEKTNGWTGLAKETIKLQKCELDGYVAYQVTSDAIGRPYFIKTFRTLRGAEKRYARLENLMVVKEVA